MGEKKEGSTIQVMYSLLQNQGFIHEYKARYLILKKTKQENPHLKILSLNSIYSENLVKRVPKRELSGSLSDSDLHGWFCFGRKRQTMENIGHTGQVGIWKGSGSWFRFPRNLSISTTQFHLLWPLWGLTVWTAWHHACGGPSPASAHSICSVNVPGPPEVLPGCDPDPAPCLPHQVEEWGSTFRMMRRGSRGAQPRSPLGSVLLKQKATYQRRKMEFDILERLLAIEKDIEMTFNHRKSQPVKSTTQNMAATWLWMIEVLFSINLTKVPLEAALCCLASAPSRR